MTKIVFFYSLLISIYFTDKASNPAELALALKQYRLSDSLYFDPVKSLEYANMSIPVLLKHERIDEYLYLLNSKSYLFNELSEYDSMEVVNRFTLKEAKRLVPSCHRSHIAALNNLATSFQIKEDWEKAIELYEGALSECSLLILDKNIRGTIFANLGKVYFKKGDVHAAIEHFNRAVIEQEKYKRDNYQVNKTGSVRIGNLFRYLGDSFVELGKLKNAQNSYEKARAEFNKIPDLNEEYEIRLKLDMISLGLIKGDQVLIRNILDKVNHEDIRNKEQKYELSKLIADVEVLKGNWKEALGLYEELLSIHKKNSVSDISDIYLRMAKCYFKLNDFYGSIQILDTCESILKGDDEKTNSDYARGLVFNDNELIEVFFERGMLLIEMYKRDGEIRHLYESVESFIKMTSAMNSIVRSYYSDESKWQYLENFKSLLAEAMAGAFELYLLDDCSGFEALLYFNEQSKSILLNIERNRKRINKSEDEADIVELKKVIRSSRAILDVLPKISDKTMMYEQRIFDSLRKLIQLQDQSYQANISYNRTPVSIKNKGHSLVDIETELLTSFYYDSLFYSLTLRREVFSAERHIIHNVDEILSQIHSCISTKKPIESSLGILRSTLLPKNTVGSVDRYIVIPDEVLSNLSFELLLENESRDDARPSVSYAYSIGTLYDQSFVRKTDLSNSTFVQQSVSDEEGIADYEFGQIGELFATTYRNHDTNIEELLKELESSRFIHFSSHSLRGEYAMNSSLQLWDTAIYERDIYSLDLSADLTVLSGCDSELGVTLPGEGVSSLGRAFTAAGSAAVLSSLWQINERSTADIIISFYKYLKEGHTKSYALAQAKRDYLNSDIPEYKKHPYYWAGLILVGNDAPLKFANWYDGYIWPLGLTLILGLVFLGYRRLYHDNRGILLSN